MSAAGDLRRMVRLAAWAAEDPLRGLWVRLWVAWRKRWSEWRTDVAEIGAARMLTHRNIKSLGFTALWQLSSA